MGVDGIVLSGELDIDYSSPSTAGVQINGMDILLTADAASGSSTTFNAIRAAAFTAADAITYNSLRGSYFQAKHFGTGTVASLVGTIIMAKNEHTGTATDLMGASIYAGGDAGNIGTCQGAAISWLSGATVTGNLFGLSINSSEALTVTGNRYGLYVAGSNTRNCFLGTLAVATGLWIGDDQIPDNNDLHIDGSINKSTALGAFVRRTTTQSISHATWTAVSYNTQVWDTDGCFAPTSSYLYARHAGYYMAFSSVRWDSNATGIRRHAIYHGGVAMALQTTVASGNVEESSIATGMFYMAVNNYVQTKVWQSSGGTRTLSASVSSAYSYNCMGLTRIA